ncbi:MAG TPA: hypothetical protein PLY87_16510 [Planctomycetaceae bacterium]|nr:hypothetical protein [Planctomycetaceae bacterium]
MSLVTAMSMYFTTCVAVVLTFANGQVLYGQSGQSPTSASAIQNASNEPQICLRLKIFEVVQNQKNASAIEEFSGKQTEQKAAEPSTASQNLNECVQSTKRLTQLLDDLTKTADGKVLSETEMMLTPGVQSRYRRGEELDFAARNPKPNRMIEMSETVGQDSTSVDAAGNGSIRFAGTTIHATGRILRDQIVMLELNAKYTEIDFSAKTNPPGLRAQSAAVSVVLEEDRSLILGPGKSHRETVSTRKTPFLSSIPGIGSAFDEQITTAQPSLIFVLGTADIVRP